MVNPKQSGPLNLKPVYPNIPTHHIKHEDQDQTNWILPKHQHLLRPKWRSSMWTSTLHLRLLRSFANDKIV